MSTKNAFQYLQLLASTQKAEKIRGSNEGESTFLCVNIQNGKYYIDVGRIGEIIPKTNISPVGHTEDWFEGIIKVQGEIYSVIDIAHFLEQPIVTGKGKFAIALAEGNNNYAILVNKVLGIHKVKTTKDHTEQKYIDSYHLSNESLNVLSIERLLASSEFANVSIF